MTVCGPGSTIPYTKPIRDALPDLLRKYEVKLLVDAGCGDQHWIKTVDLPCAYMGFDKDYEPHTDIRTDPLPECDMILCRDVMIHMPLDDIERTLDNFRKSTKLMLASSYMEHSNKNLDGRAGRRISLAWPPWNFGLLERIDETSPGKYLGLWTLTPLT